MEDADVQGEKRGTSDEYRVRFAERDGRVVECTIYPEDVTEEELVTTWISAAAGSFVDLTASR